MASLCLPSCPLSENKGPLIFALVWVPDKLWSVETYSHGKGASGVLGALRPRPEASPLAPAGQSRLVPSAPGPLGVPWKQIMSKWRTLSNPQVKQPLPKEVTCTVISQSTVYSLSPLGLL